MTAFNIVFNELTAQGKVQLPLRRGDNITTLWTYPSNGVVLRGNIVDRIELPLFGWVTARGIYNIAAPYADGYIWFKHYYSHKPLCEYVNFCGRIAKVTIDEGFHVNIMDPDAITAEIAELKKQIAAIDQQLLKYCN